MDAVDAIARKQLARPLAYTALLSNRSGRFRAEATIGRPRRRSKAFVVAVVLLGGSVTVSVDVTLGYGILSDDSAPSQAITDINA